jgi:hypothetical protein
MVAQALLAGDRTGQGESTIPRRTRQTSRRRLYGWGWFSDRQVPAPEILGTNLLGFALVRPYLEHSRRLMAECAADPANLLVWAGQTATLVMFGVRDLAEMERIRARLTRAVVGQVELAIALDLRARTVPIFFDFEGAWVRFAGLEGAAKYPQGLPSLLKGSPLTDDQAPSDPEIRAVAALVGLTSRSSPGPGSGPEEASLRESSATRRCTQRGWVQARTFLNPGAVARTIDGFPTQLAFVHGRWKGREASRELQDELLLEGSHAPFLLVPGQDEALIGMLATGSAAPLQRRGPVRPLLPVLHQFLERIEVVREPVAAVRVVVDHQYGRLLPASFRERVGEH